MVTCADFCRDNVDPISGEKSDCIGFNYYNTNSPSCAYFSKYVQVVECIINIIPHFIHSGKKNPWNVFRVDKLSLQLFILVNSTYEWCFLNENSLPLLVV